MKKKTVENAVYKMSSTEKKAELINSVINMQSWNSKSEIRKTVTRNAACSRIKSALKSISKSQNPQYNLARKVLLSTYPFHTLTEASRKMKKSLGILCSSYKSAKERTLKSILEHSQNSNQNQNIKAATKQLILDFYNRDDISKVLPYKSKTVKVKTIDNTFQRNSICVTELSLLQTFHQFKTEHSEFKVGKLTFQLLRPKNIRS